MNDKPTRKLLQRQHQHPQKRQLLADLEVPVVGGRVVGPSGRGDIGGFVVIWVGFDELLLCSKLTRIYVF